MFVILMFIYLLFKKKKKSTLGEQQVKKAVKYQIHAHFLFCFLTKPQNHFEQVSHLSRGWSCVRPARGLQKCTQGQ